MQYGALRSRLTDAGLVVNVSHLLVLPHFKVTTETVQWPRERIVDSDDIGDIITRITQLLGSGVKNVDTHERVLAFFQNRFQVEPDVSALTGRIQQAATRMSSGLAVWVPRIEAPAGVIRVIGTAGSGKTQPGAAFVARCGWQGKEGRLYLLQSRPGRPHVARGTRAHTGRDFTNLR